MQKTGPFLPFAVLGPVFAIALSISHVGCQDKQEETTGTTSAEDSGLSTNVKFSIQASSYTEAQLTPGTFEIPDDANHHFVLREVSTDNVDDYVREINRLGIRRIGLTGRRDTLVYPPDPTEQAELLRRLIQGCPDVTTMSISEWKLPISDLMILLGELKQLRELELRVCDLRSDSITQPNELHFPASKLTKLTAYHCYGLHDEHVGALLASLPDVEELMLTDTRNGVRHKVVFTGSDWPFDQLPKLRRFAMWGGSSDVLIRQLLSAAPQLESLELWSCKEITGSQWNLAKVKNLTSLELPGCDAFSETNLQSILRQTPRLQSLNIRGCNQIRGSQLDLSVLPDLRSLNLRGQHLDASFVEESLKALTNLESLTLLYSPVLTNNDIDFSRLSKLKALELDSCQFPPDVLTTLPPTLETLKVNRARIYNSCIASMLGTLPNLHVLSLTSVWGDRGYENDENAIRGESWKFESLTKLKELDLSRCPYLTNDVIREIAEQLPQLELLRLGQQRNLTGRGWDLEHHQGLRRLELHELEKLDSDLFNRLPSSLEALHVSRCSLNGEQWNFAAYPQLADLSFANMKSLPSIGANLPPSLRTLRLFECRDFIGQELDYSNTANLRSLTFSECHPFDVNRLFAELPKHAKSLRVLNLTACAAPSTNTWNMAPLASRLERIIYEEGYPSYVGGLDERNAKRLQIQLPNCRIER